MERFKIIQPDTLLKPYVNHYWILETDAVSGLSERVIPTGNIQMVFHRGDRMYSSSAGRWQPRSFLCGQSMAHSDLLVTGKVNMIVVVFQPYGARPFFKIPLNEFFGMDVSIDDLENRKLLELEDKLSGCADDHESVRLIECYLMDSFYGSSGYNYTRIGASVSLANRDGGVQVSSMAETACLSEKQFNRIFSEYVGTNPKKFLRVLRFQRALYTWQHNPHITLAQLAFDCGFYDLPHLIREFKAFSGYTPMEFLAVCVPHSDYFSNL